jgi:Ca2+-binding RTX toxin-like protein
MDAIHLGDLVGKPIDIAEPNTFEVQGSGVFLYLSGVGFTYDSNDQPLGGFATHIDYASPSGGFSGSLPLVPVVNFGAWALNDSTQLAFSTVLSGDDLLIGTDADNVIRGYAGNDVIAGFGGRDSLYGGTGDDLITAMYGGGLTAPLGTGPTYLRGEEGNDYIIGGDSFDDINGNQGNDTCSGGLGDDWVVGGKDDDLLFGDGGGDIVYGNLGNDTCAGGSGNDLIRGGQGDDSITGGGGNDFISGDRGNDTETGGSGADSFHTFSGAGIDRVLDFNLAEGDRVQLDPGTAWTATQVGADTVIDMGNGDQMILVGVQLSTLTGAWIFGA